ncbi:MAG: hypothetical protein KTR31_00090 [Myxococcales bacterium]|nr:hypothetical protein [Myxococcales bacterium]
MGMSVLGAMFVWLTGSVATAGPFGGDGKDPIETVGEEIAKEKTESEKAMEERLKAFEDSQRGRRARVVVLRWKGTDTDYSNEALQRNIRNRIARPGAKFYPEVDLYQAGRKERDRNLSHRQQRAVVPDDVIGRVLDAVDEVSQIPYSALSEQTWGLRATELRELADQIWFLDRPELREPLFLLYAYIGYAAENTNTGSPPFYEQVSGRTVNYYWYLAGALAFQEPSLMSKLGDQNIRSSVGYYKDQLETGGFQLLNLSFDDQDGEFDGEQFTKDFEVFVNGDPVVITHPEGILEVPLGRVDVYLAREDGHGLSERLDLDRLLERFYFVRQNAWKTMGLDFQEQLMTHPNECTPPLSGEILNYLSIYAKLHPASEVYIAVPFAGSVAPGRIFLWRWDRDAAQLTLVQDNTGGFPVRFALVASTGAAFSTFDVQDPDPLDLEQALVDQADNPNAPFSPDDLAGELLPTFSPVVDGVPFDLQLRGHYNRLLMAVGAQFKIGIDGENSYIDLYQTNGNPVYEVVEVDCVGGDAGCVAPGGGEPADGEPGTRAAQVTALRRRSLQRLIYATVGVVLGRDAAVGLGPRGYLRVGWTNAPHAVDITAHGGLTTALGKDDDKGKSDSGPGRTRLLVDVDAFAGVLAPFHDSLFVADRGAFAVGAPFFTFGLTGGVGVTF